MRAEGRSSNVDASPVGFEALGFELDRHIEDLCGDPGDSGFGSLLFDTRGRIAIHDGASTWLYCARREPGGPWASSVRRYDLDHCTLGSASPVLAPAPEDRWAVIHHAMQVDDGLIVAFYSNGLGVRAAFASHPAGPFIPDPDFLLAPTSDWERCRAPDAMSSLEANGCYLAIAEDEERLLFWEGYDAYCPSELGGQLGWVRLELDKRRRRIRANERDPDNPLSFLPTGHLCARCGGNLSADVRIDGQHAYFFYSRPDRNTVSLDLALSSDPMFHTIDVIGRFDVPRGNEALVEKLQAYERNGGLYLLYESRLNDGRWRTGLRRYVRSR